MNQVKILEKANNANNGKSTDAKELLNSVIFTVDPKLDELESKNTLSAKAETGKKIFLNYRKNQL